MKKELLKFLEQILNITEPLYIEKIEQQGNTINIYGDNGFCLLPLINLIKFQLDYLLLWL